MTVTIRRMTSPSGKAYTMIDTGDALRQKVGSGGFDAGRIAAAQRALDTLSEQGRGDLDCAVRGWRKAYQAWRADATAGTPEELAQAARDIAEPARALGFALASRFASSLVRLCEVPLGRHPAHDAAAKAHIDAIRAALAADRADDADEVAAMLAGQLETIVRELTAAGGGAKSV